VLSELVRPTDVAVEIDGLDEQHRIGWSVMVRGRAQAVAEPASLTPLWTVDGVVPSAPGIRKHSSSRSCRGGPLVGSPRPEIATRTAITEAFGPSLVDVTSGAHMADEARLHALLAANR
jgi:hypothetical protein